MDHLKTFAISSAGMSLERARVEAAALNIANAHTAQASGQAGFNPVKVVAQPAAPFAAHLQGADLAASAPQYQLEPANVAPRAVHDPGHPLADARGFVHYPGVDTAAEMVNMMDATRAYEANVAAMNAARALALKSLEIGGGQ